MPSGKRSLRFKAVKGLTKKKEKKWKSIYLSHQQDTKSQTAEWPAEIDLNRAEEARIRAERRLVEKSLETDLNRATLALKRATARIAAAKR